MNNWSGALMCPDTKGAYYAVGIYYAANANCGGVGGEKSPEKFETIVSERARTGWWRRKI